ncbi:unnamed protein product, partial [Musa textilis]
FSAWKDNATGTNFNSLREFLEKNYMETSGHETVKLAIGKSLKEVISTLNSPMSLNINCISILDLHQDDAEIDAIVAEIQAEKAAVDAAKKAPSEDNLILMF